MTGRVVFVMVDSFILLINFGSFCDMYAESNAYFSTKCDIYYINDINLHYPSKKKVIQLTSIGFCYYGCSFIRWLCKFKLMHGLCIELLSTNWIRYLLFTQLRIKNCYTPFFFFFFSCFTFYCYSPLYT